MVQDIEHVEIPVGEIHGLVNWVFTSIANRDAQNVTDADVHKLALVQETVNGITTRNYFFLQSANPKIWGGIGTIVPGTGFGDENLAVFDSSAAKGIAATTLKVDSAGRLYVVKRQIYSVTTDTDITEEMSGGILWVSSDDPITITYPEELSTLLGMDVVIYQKGAGAVTVAFADGDMDVTGTLATAAVGDSLRVMANQQVAMVGFTSATGGGGGGTPAFPDLAGTLKLADKVLVQKNGSYGRVPRMHIQAEHIVYSDAEMTELALGSIPVGLRVRMHNTGRVYTYFSGSVPTWLRAVGLNTNGVIVTTADPNGDQGYFLLVGSLQEVFAEDFGDMGNGSSSYIALQSAIDFAGFAGVAKVSLYRDPKKIAYLNGQFDIEHSDVELNLGKVVAGADFRGRISGNVAETGSTSLLASDTLQGSDTFQLANAADQVNYPIGSKIIVRGRRDINTFYPEPGYKQEYIVIAHPSADTLQIDRGVEVDFLQDYNQPGFDTIWGDPNYTRLYPVVSSALSGFVNRASAQVTVTDGSLFAAGDYVQLEDDKSPDIYSVFYTSAGSKVHNEINRVTAVAGNVLSLERATATSYESLHNARVIKMAPVINSKITNAKIIWAARTLNKTNALEMAYCVDCHFVGNATLGLNGFSWHRHAQRMSDCYQCSIRDFHVDSAQYQAGGEGYGVVTYGSTDCKILDGYAHKTRHSVLLARASSGILTENVLSTDCAISDFDVHGNNNNASIFRRCTAESGPSLGALQELPATAMVLNGSNWDVTVDYGTASGVTSNGANTVLIRGSGRAVITSADIDDNATLTATFAAGHPFEVDDTLTITGSVAAGYNADWLVTNVNGNIVNATQVVATGLTLAQRTWVFSPKAIVVCEAKNFDGEYTVLAINDDILTIDPDGATFVANANMDNVWVTVHEGFTKAAYRVGNPTHFWGDFDIRFEECVAENYEPSMFPLHALSSTEAVVCDPQPGVYNVVFDVKAVNCQYYTNPQRNTKSATPNIDLTPYTQEATADTVTIDLTDADQLLSVGYFIELSGTTRPELAADAYKVTAVDSTGFSFVVPGIGTFASESADGTLLKYYPYLDLRIEDIEYQIELERNIAEPTVDAPGPDAGVRAARRARRPQSPSSQRAGAAGAGC